MSHLKTHILWCFLFLGGLTIYAQETKEEIEEKALAHFEKEEFIEATPLYLRLLSLAPRDPNYNYRYGTCLLFNSKRKDVAFKYLNFAVTSGEVDMEAYYYLGRAYHLTYQFRKAIKNYEKYKQLAGARASNKLDVNRQIEMCRSGQSLLANLSETLVLRKQEIPLDEFFRIYDLKDIGGELIVTAEFQTKLDKKYNHVPLIHFPSNSNRIFYSSYGESENSGKDIFMRTRLPDKSWSLAQKVFGDVNTPYDEDFPYMHPDGRYLYFCSKGHNSMGGYDVFRSRYDPETNTYLKPENMDFAISSPDDDILYIVDSLDRYAYFASQRESEAGKINVYHVRVERIPMQIAIIKGTFASTIDPGNKELSIAVYSDATGKLMGNYATTTKGDYLINLPKGGKYQFVLQVGGKDTEYEQIIDVPYLKEFRPLKQKITETFQDGNEVVLIQNLFDELFDDPIAILAEVIQKQSQMKVNKDDYDLDSLDRLGEQRKILATLGLEGYSKLEIRQMAQSKVNDLTERLEKSEERLAQSLASIVYANKRMEILIKRADSLTLLATNTDDPQKKANYTRSAKQALENAKKQADNIESAKIIAEFMEKDRDETYKRLEKAKKFNDELVAIKADDENGFLATLNKNKLYIEEELKTRTTIDAQFELMSEISEQIKRSEEARKKQKELEEQRASLEKEIQQLKDELPNAKRKDAERIQQEIDSKENLLSDIANEQNYLNKEVEKYNQAINQQDVLANLKNQETNPDYTSIENVMNSVSKDLSTIDSRIEDNQENMALYEANESQSNTANEVIEPIQKSTEQLIEKTERSDLAYKNNEISTNEYLTEKENTLKELKKNLQSLESASDEVKSGQNYKSILAQLNEEVSQLEKDIAKAQTILSLEKELQVALENSLNQPENSNKSIKELEKELISNLNEEKSTISSDARLDSASKSSKIAAIDLLIEKLSVADGSYFEKDESIATNNSETTFNSEDKAALLSSVDRSYASEISDLEKQLSNGEISAQEVLKRKVEYVNKLEAAREDILAEIEKKGETPERLKEKAILEQELATLQSEIAELNQLIAAQEEGLATNNSKTTFNSEDKAALLSAVDRSYASEISDLEKQLSNGEISAQEVLNRKEEYVNKLEAALEDILAEIEKKGETPERLKEKAILEQELATLQSEIAELNQLIAAQEEGLATNNSKTTFTEQEKAAVLNKVDRSYSIDIGDLDEQLRNGEISPQEVLNRKEEYVNKLEAALEDILAEIEKKGETPERLKEKAILEQELATLQSEIAELNQLIAAQEEGLATNNSKTTFNSEDKAALLSAVDRSYASEISDLEKQLSNGEISAQEVLNRKEEYVNKLEAALEDILAEIEKKGETPERLKEKAILEQELATLQSEIAELNQLIAAQEEGLATNNSKTTFNSEEKAALLSAVDRSYASEISDLEKLLSNGEISAQEVLNRKEEYANKLEAALEDILAEIEKKGETPERLKEKAILEQELATLQSEIAELNQLIAAQEEGLATKNTTTSFTSEEKAAVLSKVDRSYSIDLGDLDEQLRNGEISAQEVLKRKVEYVNKLEAAREDILTEIEKKGETPERLKEKAILEQELATLQSEIEELNQLIANQEGGLATNNTTTSFTSEEKAAVLSKVDLSYSIDLGDLDEQLRNGEISAQEVLKRKVEYVNKLEAAREDILTEIEKKGETPERLKEKAILEQELATLQSEIEELNQLIANQEGGLATNNTTTSFTSEEKAAVLSKVDRSYSIDIGDLDEQLRNGEVSPQEVLNRKVEYANKLEAAREDILAEIEKKGETPERLKEKAILEQELATLQSEIAELNQLIAAQEEGLATNNNKTTFTEEEKAAVLNKIDRSYSIDIGDLDEQLRNGEISAQEVLNRKEEYANKLEAAREDILAEIEKKGETPERLKEKAILEQELERINLEINELQTPLANGEEESIDAIVAQSELSETEKSAITSTENNLSALKNKLAALDKLTLALQKQVSIETNESKKINLTKQIETVEKKKRQVSFEIGELEQENIAALIPENVTEATTEKQKRDIESSQEKVNTLSESKSDLQASLLNANSENEKEKIQSKIDKTDEKIAKEEADVLNTTTRVSEEVLANEFNDLNKEDKETISTLEADRLRLNAESLIQQAENEKDPVAKRNLLAAAQEKQNEALASIEKTKSDKQQQAIVAEIITSENIAIKEPEAVFKSEQKLAQEQQSIDVQLMQIKEQINEIDFLSRTASKKEVETLETRRAELVQLQKQLISKRKSNEEDLALIQQEKEATKSKGIDEESIDYQLSYKEEVEIAESDKYKALFPAINKLEQKQYEMKVKEEFIALNTEKINQVLANNPSPTQQEKEEVVSLLKTIANEQSNIETLKLEIREQQEVIQTLLPSDPREREITQNLLARSVNPIDKAPILPVMATGLIIANENEKVYSSENPIPIDAEKPKGLFFRVQIGAFGKPVPNETFNDFSPVSGEQVRPGLIRYMAGYFGGRRDAEQARDRIRTMGYNDAFVVAYCDGERIPVYRAVQLMESGACVPSIKSSESPILTASENGTELSSGGFEAELDEFAYNKAPGAADAVAGETKLGLYYTVQVGVYNRPVPASQLKNISPLVTMRLPNGQMRYSSGMFDDVPQARTKQQEAVSLGISDAYIVAYYKGERISVSQANKLLGEFGNSILESVTPTTRKKNNLESTVSAPTPPAEPVLKNKKVTVQYRSKETYNSYPTQVLNRYNENEGFFYYDEITSTIQSALYSEEMAPSLSLIQNELEEVRYYSVFEIADKEAVELDLALKNTDQLVHQLTINLASNEISDDLINTFLKANLLKRITSIESGLILEFYEIGTADKINSIQTEMARLGATEINKTVLKCDLNK